MAKIWNQFEWIEIWFDMASSADYLLVLRKRVGGSIELIDPQKMRQLITVFTDYEEATDWLIEDEFTLAEGRWQPPDH